MNALQVFWPHANSGIGFDSMFKRLEQFNADLAKTTAYPPYNIKKIDDNHYVIEMAVAGFGKQNLDIQISDGVLTIKGNSESDTETEDKENANFIYRGIANRAFTRKFTLADTIEIKNAELLNGMLRVFLENIIPDNKKPKKVEVTDVEPSTKKEKK